MPPFFITQLIVNCGRPIALYSPHRVVASRRGPQRAQNEDSTLGTQQPGEEI